MTIANEEVERCTSRKIPDKLRVKSELRGM